MNISKNSIIKYFPLVPIWLFLLICWKTYGSLVKIYPDTPLLYVGIVVTSIVGLISVLFLIKIQKKTFINRIEETTAFEKKLAWSLLIGFSTVVIITSIIHHKYPVLFGVPDTPNPYMMTGRMEKWMEGLIVVLSNLFIAAFALIHSKKKYGLGKTALFFFGAMIFAGMEENEWIVLSGRILGHPSYYFTSSLLWFIQIPVYTCFGWYFIAYGTYEIINTIFPTGKRLVRTALAGLLGMSLDLFADPILVNVGRLLTPQTDYGFWHWDMKGGLELFSIPFMNFIGWFLLIFFFITAFEITCENIDSKKWDWKTATKKFFISFIFMWILCTLILEGFTFLTDLWFPNTNIVPIDFPLLN